MATNITTSWENIDALKTACANNITDIPNRTGLVHFARWNSFLESVTADINNQISGRLDDAEKIFEEFPATEDVLKNGVKQITEQLDTFKDFVNVQQTTLENISQRVEEIKAEIQSSSSSSSSSSSGSSSSSSSSSE